VGRRGGLVGQIGAQRVADRAVGLAAVLPVGDDLARGGAVRLAAVAAFVAPGHVHRAAVGHVAARHLPLRALVRVQLEHELLLDELALLLLEDSAWSRG